MREGKNSSRFWSPGEQLENNGIQSYLNLSSTQELLKIRSFFNKKKSYEKNKGLYE